MTQRIPLSLQDSLFLLAETRHTPVHVGGLQIYRLPPDAPAHFTARLYDRLRRYPAAVPPLNCRLAGGLAGRVLPGWEPDPAVDLDYHFRRSALPAPAGQHELAMLVSELHSTPMDLARPLWECHLVEGLAGGRFAIYTKLHHAMVDGVSGMRLVHPATDPKSSDVPPFWADESLRSTDSPAEPRPLARRLPEVIGDELQSLPSLARGLATTARTALGLGEETHLASIAEAPRTLFNVRVGARRLVATQAVRLARLKAIGDAGGGTVNDVVLAACSGALRRYLRERSALPRHSLIAAVPMALHHDAGVAAGNAVSCLLARLGTDTDDVRERFATVCRSTAAGKAQLRSMSRTAAMRFVTLLSLPVLLQGWVPGVDRLIGPSSNLLVSNLPGSPRRLYFHGAKMLAHYPVSQVAHGMALNVTVVSYAGGLYFGLVACPDAVPDLERLAEHLGTAVEELEATFVGTRPSRAAPGPAIPRSGRNPARSHT
jgi:WS/DGAT/MGAT family acyltransferase